MTRTKTGRPLRGTVARLVELYEKKLPVLDLFGTEGAALYDNMSRNDRSEVPEFLRVGGPAPRRVLELACGNGRTTLPLLEAGYEVVGLDSSPDMLGRLADRLAEPQWGGYAGKLETVEGDMTAFSLDRRFDLVLLGTSTVWMLDAEGRASLFKSVYEHLEDGGKFLLTLLHFTAIDEAGTAFERTTNFVGHGTDAPALCTLYDYVDPKERLRTMSILAHRVEGGRITGSAVHTTSTNLISPTELAAEIERSGLTFVAEHEVHREQLAKQDPGGRHWVLLEVTR
ncbi:daptide-type RiPP biosynthesis methyltransferase [Streptosporangium saharense]|uniref:daptide-type RiPP biosynthesis methyltransferase n=1 Tax=Streptosporangium saharense TaxID=1706840 RepID=UPI00368E7711